MAANVRSLSVLLSSLLLLWSCSLAPTHLQIQQAGDVSRRQIKRIAVLGASSVPDSERKLTANEISESFRRALYLVLAEFQDWQIVSEREVQEVEPQLRSESDVRARTRKLGELVHADGVLFGQVLYFRERIGEAGGAKSPASVTFVLELLDVRRGDVIWRGRFEETQRPLSENLFEIGTFAKRGARFLTGEELAADGIKRAVRELHQTLFP